MPIRVPNLVRILYTNGPKTYDIFWLNHDGRNVYCGNRGADHHISYHESGEFHVKSKKGKEYDKRKHVPLAKIDGKYNLLTFLFRNTEDWFEDYQTLTKFSGGKSDAALIIDSRSIPKGAEIVMSIGLLEAGRAEGLMPMMLAHKEIDIEAKQILLATSVRPWVYVILYRATKDHSIRGPRSARVQSALCSDK